MTAAHLTFTLGLLFLQFKFLECLHQASIAITVILGARFGAALALHMPAVALVAALLDWEEAHIDLELVAAMIELSSSGAVPVFGLFVSVVKLLDFLMLLHIHAVVSSLAAGLYGCALSLLPIFGVLHLLNRLPAILAWAWYKLLVLLDSQHFFEGVLWNHWSIFLIVMNKL